MTTETDQLLASMGEVRGFVAQWGSPHMEAVMDKAIERIARQKAAGAKRYRFSAATLQEHIAAGLSTAQIAEKHECHKRTVYYWIRRLGLPKPQRARRVRPAVLWTKNRWSREEDEALRTLWSEGNTCAEIAASMGTRSRNMVIGRAHRLGLEGRASPIKRAA